MLLEQNKNKKQSSFSLRIKKPTLSSFIVSKSKLFSLFVCMLTIAVSYYFSLYYVKGDQIHYTGFYNNIKDLDIITAFILYRNSLGTSEPIYFIIVYLASGFFNKNIFMALINGVFMFYISRLMTSRKISKSLVLSLVFNFYFLVLFLAAERLKFSLLFFVLFIYYYQYKKRRMFFLVLSILSHVQTLLLLISGYINRIFKSVIKIFTSLKVKKSIYVIVLFTFSLFILYFLKDHIFRKMSFYSEAGNRISDIIKPIAFTTLTFLIYKKDFGKIFLMFLPLIVSSYIFGGDRVVIFAYFLLLYLSFKKSSKVNIYILITSIYFTYKGVLFINDVMLYGHGF